MQRARGSLKIEAVKGIRRAIFKKFLDSSDSASFAYRFRKRRLALLLELFRPEPEHLVLDLGTWGSFVESGWPYPDRLVALDRERREALAGSAGVKFVVGDGRALPFGDGCFDLLICNSVIEHVGGAEDQARLASEIRRVARRYFVQVPYKYFPVDPHYFTIPYFQLLPERLQRLICRCFPVGYLERGQYMPIRYPTARELRRLFPEAEIRRERLLFLTKSLYVIKR